jgi:hypothetical protein
MNAPSTHPSTDVLLDWWLHDSDPATTEAVDAHLMQCEACGQILDGLVVLGDGVRAAFRAGAVSAVTTDAFVRRLAGQGLRVREYRLAHNGSVNCTVAPEDELLVAHLEAPLQGIERLDARTRLSFEPGVEHALHDVPFDPRTGEVLYIPSLAGVREMPAHDLEVVLTAMQPGTPREVGRYLFHHRPWPGW